MNIVILHCHFERGGVTQVVENHLKFLSRCPEVDKIFLVSGKRIGGLSEQTHDSAQHLCVEAMDYDSILNPTGSIEERATLLASQIADRLSAHHATADDTVLHWHNHSLGKNVAAPASIVKLAGQRWRLLLQVHDFAEDNRPSNYAKIVRATNAVTPHQVDAFLYPTADQIHYATLTQADLKVFAGLGIRQSRIHCLPNSVTAPGVDTIDRDVALDGLRKTLGLPADARWCLYPVRGIRRKNVGELLLLSRWLNENTYAGITLRPTTPIEAKFYDRWQALAKEVAPRTVFNAGHHDDISFAQNLAASDYVLSTSVAEGFGMVFLEPWLSGRSVIARSLPTVARDFQAAGLQFPLLYDAIHIPGDRDWIGKCVAESQAANQKAWSMVPSAFCPDLSSAAAVSDTIDFAKLTVLRQAEVLYRLSNDGGFERDARHANQRLCEQLCMSPDEKIVHHNADRVREFYSPESQGVRLLQTYQQVLARSTEDANSDPIESRHPSMSAIDCVSAMRPVFPCRTEEFSDD